MANTNPKVFLSYAQRDREFARSLSKAIEELGGEALLDADFLEPGTNFGEAVRGMLEKSNIFVFVVPQQEGEGKNALFEIGAAKALGKRIIAIVPDGTRSANTEVALRLADYPILDAIEKSAEEIARSVVEAAAA